MAFKDFIRRQYRVVARRRSVTALDHSVSKQLIDQLKGMNRGEMQDILDGFVEQNHLKGDDVSDLMYDLGKAGYHHLTKPRDAAQKRGGGAPNLIEAAKKGDWAALAKGVQALQGKKDAEFQDLTEFFKNHQDLYGKFISAAEKAALGVYENTFHIPITKKALEHVSDDYIVDSILYASLYGGKNLPKDAIEYAFDRLQNPLKAMQDISGTGSQILEMGYNSGIPGFDKKLDKWFKALDKKHQDEIRRQFDPDLTVGHNNKTPRQLPN